MEVAVRVGKHFRSRRMPWQALCHILNQRGFTNGIRVLVLGRSTLTLEWGSAKHPERTSATHVAKASVTQRNHEPVSSMKRTAAVSWYSFRSCWSRIHAAGLCRRTARPSSCRRTRMRLRRASGTAANTTPYIRQRKLVAMARGRDNLTGTTSTP